MSDLQKAIDTAVSDVRSKIKPMSLAEREALAKKAKITVRTIYNVMQPDYKPSLKTLSVIQKALRSAGKSQ